MSRIVQIKTGNKPFSALNPNNPNREYPSFLHFPQETRECQNCPELSEQAAVGPGTVRADDGELLLNSETGDGRWSNTLRNIAQT